MMDPQLLQEAAVQEGPEGLRVIGIERRRGHPGVFCEIDQMRGQTLLHLAHPRGVHGDVVTSAHLGEELRE